MPRPPPMVAVEDLRAEHAELLTRYEQLLEASTRLPQGPPATEAEAGRLADFAKQIAAARNAADDARVAAKSPYLEAGRILENFFAPVIDRLNIAQDSVEQRLAFYLLARNVDGPLRG